MYLETVRALAAAIEAKDHYTAEHGDMLASMAIAVGRRLGLDDDALRDVQYAAVLHDIGKIGIPGTSSTSPTSSPTRSSPLMAEHTIIGERIISHIDYLAPDRRHHPLGARALGRTRVSGQARRRADPARPRASCSSATPTTP